MVRCPLRGAWFSRSSANGSRRVWRVDRRQAHRNRFGRSSEQARDWCGHWRQWFNVEHVDVITDLANSAVGFAVLEIAKPLNKIVLVSGPGSSDFTGKACAPISIHWTWDTFGAATTTARAIVGPDANTWFFIASDYAFGRALERDGASAVEKAGGKVVGHVWPPTMPILAHFFSRRSRVEQR